MLPLNKISHLVGQSGALGCVLVVGLGSGGFPVMQHLAMSGCQDFILIDPDRMDELNLVKHPALRRDIGREKVAIAADWLEDRNPSIRVETLAQDIFDISSETLARILHDSSVVVVATDNNASRYYLNDLCIEHGRSMVVGLVHRGGTGGTVFMYRPLQTGCYACMEVIAGGLDGLPAEDDRPLSEVEQEMIYGRGIDNYGTSGLSTDIAMIAAMHAQLALGELYRISGDSGTAVTLSDGNWLAVGIRNAEGLEPQTIVLDIPPIDDCASCGSSSAPQLQDKGL